MLKSLQIRNYILIDSLDVVFPEGLVIITGQTGAGKSILLGALSLVLGSKADASVIGSRGDNCVVEAVFEVPPTDSFTRNILEENELDDESGELVIRRVVSSSGRSRSFVNDSPVNLQILQAISSRLVDIHAQHQTQTLSDKSFQLLTLDHFAGNASLLERCSASFRSLRRLESELAEVNSELLRLEEEGDYLRSRLRRLSDANLREGELEELEREREYLSNVETIKESLLGAEGYLDTAALKEARKLLEKAGRFVPETLSLAERVESARVELNDILEEVESIDSRTEVSDRRIEEVDERLSLLYDLMKRYSASSVSGLIALRDGFSESLSGVEDLVARRDDLSKRIIKERDEFDSLCLSLHQSREAAKGKFAESIISSLRSLELERAVFEVELTGTQPGLTGSDSVRFLFSASGDRPTDVAKCASGGELSRLMLCLKAMMARFVSMPTLIFDEIDSGVSGSAADKMGQMICSMGDDMQVFAITHLPQVAAKGDAHYIVEKSFGDEGALTTIRQVSGEERVSEIARMLSGSHVTAAAIGNARALLSD